CPVERPREVRRHVVESGAAQYRPGRRPVQALFLDGGGEGAAPGGGPPGGCGGGGGGGGGGGDSGQQRQSEHTGAHRKQSHGGGGLSVVVGYVRDAGGAQYRVTEVADAMVPERGRCGPVRAVAVPGAGGSGSFVKGSYGIPAPSTDRVTRGHLED